MFELKATIKQGIFNIINYSSHSKENKEYEKLKRGSSIQFTFFYYKTPLLGSKVHLNKKEVCISLQNNNFDGVDG